MSKENYEQVKTDVDDNEKTFEKLEIQAVDLKCEFNIAMSKYKSLFSNSNELINQNINKPKFKPRDLAAPK